MKRSLCLACLACLNAGALPAFGGDAPLPEHPRPQLVRDAWQSLNGEWAFQLDPNDTGVRDKWHRRRPADLDAKIIVPYSWTSRASGIARPDYRGAAWYAREIALPEGWPGGKRVLLRIERCDHHAEVYVNGKQVGSHSGGYTPFAIDITDALSKDKQQTLVIRAQDTQDPNQPIGLQGVYTPLAGIWGTVWLELTPADRIEHLAPDRAQLHVETPGEYVLRAGPKGGMGLIDCGSVTVKKPGLQYVRWNPPLIAEDAKAAWTPDSPSLVELDVRLVRKGDADQREQVDNVTASLAPGPRPERKHRDNALREFFFVGDQAVFLRGAGYTAYWPDTLGTPPSDEAIVADLKRAKALGLNALRLKGTVPSRRMVHHADRLGVVLMVDLPSSPAIRFEQRSDVLEDWTSHVQKVNDSWFYVRPWDSMCIEFIRQYRMAPSIWMTTEWQEPLKLGDAGRPAMTLHWLHWRWHNLYSWAGFHTVEWHGNSGRCIQPSWWDLTLTTRDFDTARLQRQTQLARQRYRVFEEETVNHTDQRAETLIFSDFGRTGWWTRDTEIATSLAELTRIVRDTGDLAGFFWCDLTDTEWRKTGLIDYDRKAKVFDYGRLADGWTVESMFAPVFLLHDGPLVRKAMPGSRWNIPARIVFSTAGKVDPPRAVVWEAEFRDSLGRSRTLQRRRIELRSGSDVSRMRPLAVPGCTFTMPDERGLVILSTREPASGAMTASTLLVDGAAGVPDANQLALQFSPGDYHAARGAFVHNAARLGFQKVAIEGDGYVEYRLKVPSQARDANAAEVTLLLEAASCAYEAKIDARLGEYPWSRKRNLLHMEDYRVRLSGGLTHQRPRMGYPQTDATKWPSRLTVALAGKDVAKITLEDDYAGAAGVLSTYTGLEPGSYGKLLRVDIPADAWNRAVADVGEDGEIALRLAFARPEGKKTGGGLSIYGEQLGAHPVGPTLLVTLDADDPQPGLTRQLTPAGAWWRGANPYITDWQVLGPDGSVDRETKVGEGNWYEMAADVTTFRPWPGRSVRPLLHPMPLLTLSSRHARDAEAVAVSYVHVPEDRVVCLWTGATDPWWVTVAGPDGKRSKPIGLYHKWLGVVPDCRMARLTMKKGWNEVRVWTRHANNGVWQFSVCVTDRSGQKMTDVTFAASPEDKLLEKDSDSGDK